MEHREADQPVLGVHKRRTRHVNAHSDHHDEDWVGELAAKSIARPSLSRLSVLVAHRLYRRPTPAQ